MNKVTLYTTEPCGFCRQAKALLGKRGLSYEEINLAKDADGRAELAKRTGMMTFPQVVIGEQVVGGFNELVSADRSGRLAALVAD
jgi:glutaredoxin 3